MDLTNSPGHLNHQFVAEDAAILRAATEMTPNDMNGPMNELVNVIVESGLVPNAENHTQVLEAIKRFVQRAGNYAIDTGAANAYAIALNPAIVAYEDGMTVRFKIINGNTGASTLNAGGGVVPLVNDAGGALVQGDAPAGNIVTATYITATNKFYITSMVQSQGDARYAQLGQLTGRNVIVNGDCSVSQVNGTTLITPAGNSYPIDNVQYSALQASKFQTDQTAALFGALGGVMSLRTTVAAQYAPLATDVFNLQFPIEGLNFARFKYGTANAKAGSLQFKVLTSVAGTYAGCIANYAGTRSYPFTFSIDAGEIAAGGKLVKIENIPGDIGGAWVGATNAGAAEIRFDLGCGANFAGAAGAWAAGDYRTVAGATKTVSQIVGSTFSITDVQFEVGAYCTQFERKLYDQVEQECQKYLPLIRALANTWPIASGGAVTPTAMYYFIPFNVPTRVQVTSMVSTSIAHFIHNGVSAGAANGVTQLIASLNGVFLNMGCTAQTAGVGDLHLSTLGDVVYFEGARI